MQINVKDGTNAGWKVQKYPVQWTCGNCNRTVNPKGIVNKCPLCGEYKKG